MTKSGIIQKTVGALLALAFILGPPVIFELSVLLYATATYSGICPGIMDIAPYPCSLWEYIGRNTVSPFALPIHLLACGGWFGFSVVLVAVAFVIWRLIVHKSGSARIAE